jgi:hypothetical protein
MELGATHSLFYAEDETRDYSKLLVPTWCHTHDNHNVDVHTVVRTSIKSQSTQHTRGYQPDTEKCYQGVTDIYIK